ncbi:HEAT repeat domain-containing protein [Actinomadura luteofluorescens]|uniref:HEAT repeat domain-containing protein n=1 Tax=Actinomadura luteofluorescens TaxID=46163 RepID=UPI00362B67B7
MGEPLAGLDGIDWAGLDHAYGSAEDVPGLLRALSSSDEEKREAAVGELFTNIFHQGSRYGASAAAVPFLVALAADPDTPERTWPLYLASALAIGYDEAHLPSGVDITAWREETARLRNSDPATEARRLDAWVAEAANEQERRARAFDRDHFDFAWALRSVEAELAAYDAVRTVLPTVRTLLGDDDAGVRAAAAYTAGWFPEEASATLSALDALLDAEQDPTVIAHALIAAGLLTGETPPAQSRDHLTTPAASGEQTPHAQTRDRLTVVGPAGGSTALARSREHLVAGRGWPGFSLGAESTWPPLSRCRVGRRLSCSPVWALPTRPSSPNWRPPACPRPREMRPFWKAICASTRRWPWCRWTRCRPTRSTPSLADYPVRTATRRSRWPRRR